MFQTFSGSSRRPRNVNLSGQPRSSVSGGSAAHSARTGGSGGHSAVIQAQQERRARQIERERQLAVKTLQRHWRGFVVRGKTRTYCRKRWDAGRARMETEQHGTDGQMELKRARLLGWFANRSDAGDRERVCVFAAWLDRVTGGKNTRMPEEWRTPLVKLSRFALDTLDSLAGHEPSGLDLRMVKAFLSLVALTAGHFPDNLAFLGRTLYSPLGKIMVRISLDDEGLRRMLADAIVTSLTQSSASKETAYESFICEFLTIPELNSYIDLTKLAIIAENNHLAKAMRHLLSTNSEGSLLATTSQTQLLWVLGSFVHLIRQSTSANQAGTLNIDFIAAVTSLLSHLGNTINQRQNIHDTTNAIMIPQFVDDEIASLISQETITSLIAHSEFGAISKYNGSVPSDGAAILASYALILLQSFPRRADEIRGWLYMSSTPLADGMEEPAIKYFWRAVERSQVYRDICQGSQKAVNLLKQDQFHSSSVEQEWRVIFLFLELYTFVLKIMDDDEFMLGSKTDTPHISWTRQSALELSQVRSFTIFLKNLAFAMYWNASEIMGAKETVEPRSLSAYFGHASLEASFKSEAVKVNTHASNSVAGVEGMTVSYMKGVVTGLLRMLYERDSRRHFCEAGHWLMNGLEMRSFIEDVVVEQAFRDQRHEDSDEEQDNDAMDLDVPNDEDSMVGTARTQQIRRLEKLRARQQRSSRQKLLKSLTPRLEILQNMPFFIPFATRVEIFRQFVTADQLQRRNGFLDPDQWRFSVAGGMAMPSRSRVAMHELSKHSAKVRRSHVFDDAFQQFYGLGEGLKEPIQITFVDQFDTPEAGIDGGGVTKEFLTSITMEAFSTEHGGNLFVENEEHLLYPNPSAIDERRELLREAGVAEGSPEWNMHIRELLQQYEFLGRVVGKCLYEGILEDIHFAPFFLVKWALTGGSSAAANESGYRANINDLRDLDRELFDNLLKLKNYPGNVEDFALDFTITDVVQRDATGAPKKSVSRALGRGGANTPVNNKTRLIYISAVARHRLQTQPAAQTNAFLQGLAAMIQPAWLSMFNQSELQTLLGGDAAEIDVADLRANTLYGGVYAIGDDGKEHPTVQDFWNVLAEMGDADRRKVLKYVTSTPRGPLLGFGQLNPRFSIRDSGSDQSRLPSTSTCVNLLKLPIYSSKATLREKLLYAVNAGAGFNLS